MQTRNRPPIIVAKLDLSDAQQRTLHDFIRRSHTGRWPLWRALAMRQQGPYIYEAACWQRRARGSQRERFCLLRWDPATCAVKWQDMPSRKATFAALKTLTSNPAPTNLHPV